MRAISIIDATLPALHQTNCKLDLDYCSEWINTLVSLGVEKIKTAADSLFLPEAILGFDQALLGDYLSLFSKLRAGSPPEIAFGDSLGCATALGVAWLEEGGENLLCATSGEAGLPALEAILIFRHIAGLKLLPPDGGSFKKMRNLYQVLAGKKVAATQPVIGPAIFAVESGIHVDGLLKDTAIYEPFPPQLVGASRLLNVGRHSGRNSIKYKCHQMNLNCPDNFFPELLVEVRNRSTELARGLTDDEFKNIYTQFLPASDQ
ncbi:MAG: hypothetical protein AMR96_02695 [Candidatus Adiutrix intracellularis]|nr:MAG: hypothetical protein AMR96_02695 [Candidatus Adiutrix intracellularis]MDR2826849.1 hypothetical protein [Candidatus Adiutrix intracellularis]